jgi:mannose-6-phosphate isomerase
MLSVQVHPSDAHRDLIPADDSGKTEAWVVIDAHKDSLIYAGLKPGTTEIELRESLANGTVTDHLAGITPKPGDGVFIPAGTVHTLGGGVVVFEVQQNSDVTFRLYDWGHVDPKTGQPRSLHVDQALACIDFAGIAGGLVAPHVETASPVERERLFDCEHFRLYRLLGEAPFPVGAANEPHVLICIAGAGRIEHHDLPYGVGKGDVWILPAEAGECVFRPSEEITLLEIKIPG